jgi:protein-disulfide isomerase
VNRSWLKVALFSFAVALVASQLAGQAKPVSAVKSTLTPAALTLKKSMGSPQAPITLEIFSDYQCPACQDMYLHTTLQLIDNYVNTGKVYLVHRDFPLDMHPYSREAARWLNAVAAATSSFEAAEMVMYNKQDQWGATGNIEQTLAGALPPAEMNKVRAVELSERAQLDAAVQSDIALGKSRNIDGTPTVFVIQRGRPMVPLPSGPVPYVLLKQYLDSLLQQR